MWTKLVTALLGHRCQPASAINNDFRRQICGGEKRCLLRTRRCPGDITALRPGKQTSPLLISFSRKLVCYCAKNPFFSSSSPTSAAAAATHARKRIFATSVMMEKIALIILLPTPKGGGGRGWERTERCVCVRLRSVPTCCVVVE